jgi:hypothetical protein
MCLPERICYSVAGGLYVFKEASLRIETKELSKTKTNFEVNISGFQQA